MARIRRICLGIAVPAALAMGGCSGSDDETVDPRDERAARVTLERWLDVGDGPELCRLMTDRARGELMKYSEQDPCVARDKKGQPEVESPKIEIGAEDGLALAAVTYGKGEGGSPIYVLRQQEGEWRVDDFFGIPNPERLEDADLDDEGAREVANNFAVASAAGPNEPDSTDRIEPQLIVATGDVALAYFDEVGANATEIDYEGDILFLVERNGTWRESGLTIAYPE